MKHSFQAIIALSAFVAVSSFGSMAEETNECNIKINSIAKPAQSSGYLVSPSLSHTVSLNLGNNGTTAIEGASVVVSLDETELFTETIDTPIANGWKATTVTLTNQVTFTPGATQTLTVKLLPPEGYTDTKESDNIKTQQYIVPNVGAFPYQWDAAAAEEMYVSVGGGYTYDSENGTIVCKSTARWNNYNLLTKTVDVPEGQTAKLTFKYKSTSTAGITFSVTAVGVESEETIGSIELQDGSDDFIFASIPFIGNGKTVFKLHAQPASTSGNSLVLTDISIVNDEPDMACQSILYPNSSNIAFGNPINVVARFENTTGLQIVNPNVSYTFGDVTVEEVIEGTIEPGSTIDYTFKTPLDIKEATNGTLTVKCAMEGDSNPDNDECSVELSFYAPFEFPYVTDFSTAAKWTIADADNNGVTWTVSRLSSDAANGILVYPRFMSSPKDYAFTPAISMPAGKSRVSFYIGGSIGSKVNVLMGKSMNPDEMTVVANAEVTVDGWQTVAALYDIEEAGAYYFAFDCVTSRGEILIDNLNIDRGNDLAVKDITFDTESGFKKSTAKVTMSVTNFGIDPQSNIALACYVNTGTDNKLNKFAEGVITEAIQPGETYDYTFATPLDISTPGVTYTLVGEIVTKVGSDTQNDSSMGQSLTHYPSREVPYFYGFEDPERNSQWTMVTAQGCKGWVIGQDYTNTYEGDYTLGHSSNGATNEGNDWAFSECINIPAGTYEFAMFYRTFKNQTSDRYVQSFKVMLGTAADAAAMTKEIVAKENITVPGSVHEKFNGTFTIEEDGDYYLGFYNSSPVGLGLTYIDAVSISPEAEGVECPYTADFANAADEWEVYYPTVQSWTYSADDNAMVMNRNSYYAAMAGSAGWLVSPCIKLVGGQEHNVAVEYSLSGDEADAPGLGVYVAPVNNPSEFTLVQKLDPSEDFKTANCVIPATEKTEGRYIAIRPTMESASQDYAAKVKSFVVSHNTSSSVSVETYDTTGVVEAARYDVNGRLVPASYKGIVIVHMSDGTVHKEIVK